MVYMYHSFLINLPADGHLGCFHVLAMTNSAAMNIGVHVSLSDLVSLVCMPRSGIAGTYGSSLSSYLRNISQFLKSESGRLHRRVVKHLSYVREDMLSQRKVEEPSRRGRWASNWQQPRP